MVIIIPAFISDKRNIDLILDQLYVTIESYYQQGNKGSFLIYSNNSAIKKAMKHYNSVFGRDVKVEYLDFIKEWERTKLKINEVRTRKNFIISKMVIPFVFSGDYLLMDWDMLNTGYFEPNTFESKKIRFFNAKFYDGATLRQVSIWKGTVPEVSNIERLHWVNSGLVYFPQDLQKKLILEYWDKYDSVKERCYRGVHLYDIIGDEMIYNLMLIDGNEYIEECSAYNMNVVFKNFYYTFDTIPSMYSFGKRYPYILNVHFVTGLAKPYNMVIDDKENLSFNLNLERYNLDNDDVRWAFDTGSHRASSFFYNALMFSAIWQHTRFSIKEKLGLTKEKLSQRYLDFFNRCFLKND
jgi:hypothetical protein